MNRSKTLQNQALSVILTLVLLHFDSLSSISSIFLGIYKKIQSIVDGHFFMSRTGKVFLNHFAFISWRILTVKEVKIAIDES